MTLVFRYANADSSWNVDLGTSVVRLGTLSVTETASVGQPASSSIVLDDPTGAVGHSGDGVLGLKSFVVLENTAPVNDQRIFTGYLGDRRYRRGPASGNQSSLRVGVERLIDCDLVELDAAFSFSIVPPTDTTGNRPSETPAARLTWLLGTGYVDMADHGLVIYPTTPLMDPADYRNRYPSDVMADLAMASGFNFWLYIDDTIPAMSLWFDDPNTSTAYTSTLRVSNVLSDLDTTTAASFLTGTTFAMDGIEVTVSPDRVESGLSIPYASNSLYLTRPATGVTYAARDRVAPNSNVTTAAMATTQAGRMLQANATEDVTITCSVDVPAAKVNAIRKGHRIQAKVSFMSAPVDYTAYTWFRVVQRTVRQAALTDDRYTIDLKLSPQETAPPCVTLDLNLLHGTVTVDTPRGSGRQWQRPTDSNDGNVVTFSQIDNGFGDFVSYLKSDLGAAYEASAFQIIDRGDNDAMPSGFLAAGDIEYSTDAITWHVISYTMSPLPAATAYGDWMNGGALLTFAAPITARYWAIKASNGGAGAFISRCDCETWAILGCS